MLAFLLHEDDAVRAREALDAVLANPIQCALTGSLAVNLHLQALGRRIERRALTDIDLVVDGIESIPDSLAGSFLFNHVHPHAPEGKILLQLVDPVQAVRIDLFRAFGRTMSRARAFGYEAGTLSVVAVEDLMARVTAHVCGSLRSHRAVDCKHSTTLVNLLGIGDPRQLATAWLDHRQGIPETFDDACAEALRRLALHPELLVTEKYSTDAPRCDKCQDYGRFRVATSARIIEILGYQ